MKRSQFSLHATLAPDGMSSWVVPTRKSIQQTQNLCARCCRVDEISARCYFLPVNTPVRSTAPHLRLHHISLKSLSVLPEIATNAAEKGTVLYNAEADGRRKGALQVRVHITSPRLSPVLLAEKEGHISTKCPKSKREVPEKRVNLCTMAQTGQLKLGSGETFPFLFDTGSDCSLITRSVADRFCGKRICKITNLKGIGSGSFVYSEQILTRIEIQGLFVDILFFVVPDDFISTQVILGNDLVEQRISVNYSSTGLFLSRELQVQSCQKAVITSDHIRTDATGTDKDKLISLLNKY